ncbi:Chromosome partition protein Smc [Planctomycetes bacterium MalM25]|nr:Chromosome partition protein Smc [Planctomycetes bacterium MalM25]
MLKSLQLDGFKSFAEKTRLEFPEGVTVVVGPNGSGKSNVVDGVKWVLGSQSPRSLRGKEMTDVIFNGSESRGPAPSAEVTLAFDNTPPEDGGRRLFDFDEPEIRLTRRVGRSGEGEYFVNGHACRLKDFRELLAGTGVGADSYSIIEQGRVDAALRASPLERRLLLEEAAGISRFRLKKREAARRLDRVEQNLLRLSDIVDEVEGRLRRVRSQAGKAQRYREASRRLKEARTELAASEWRHCRAEQQRLDVEHADLSERLAADQAAIKQQEGKLAELAETSVAGEADEQALQQARQRVSRCERRGALQRVDLEKAQSGLRAAREALLAARWELAGAGPDEETLRALDAAEATDAEYRSKVVQAEQQAADAHARARQIAERHGAVRARSERRATLKQRADALGASVAQRLASLTAAIEEMAAEQAESARLAALAGEELVGATSERDAAADALLRIDNSVAAAQRELTELRRQLAELQNDAATQREALVGLKHRLESILEEERRLERLNEDVQRLVAEAAASEALPLGVHGLVADLIHVEGDFVPMVEAALAARAEHVVIDSRAALLDALLRSRAAGQSLTTRAGFQSLDTAIPANAIDQIDLSNEPGVLGRATDFIEVEPRYATLVRRLFGRTWFVESLAVATRLNDSIGVGLTFVAASGEVVGDDGGVSAGPNDSPLRMLTRREDADRLRQEIATRSERLQTVEREAAAIEQRLAAGERAIEQAHESAKEERARLASAAQQAAALDERRRQAEATRTRIASQVGARGSLVALLRERSASLGVRSAALAQQEAQQVDESQVRQAQADLAAARARRDELKAAAERHAKLLGSLRSEASSHRGAGREELVASAEVATRAFAESRTELALSEAGWLNANDALAHAMLHLEAAENRLRQSRAARRASEQIRLDLTTAIASARADVETLIRRASEIELRRQRVEIEATTVAQRVRDDYGVEVAELPDPKGEPGDPQALRREIDSLREEVQGIGSVNLESLEELDELENRFATLSGQYADLSEAKKSLARLTARINTDSRQLFKTTFETVREHFRELFARLFGGGEADLLLVEPADGDTPGDPLEAGVEIVACPPGKELRSLSLLSGGEKTMTCVALLLALFRSRPSPFCLLDEVDAALDEANVGRFLEVLKDFLGSTQFIVITHSKRTMAGANTIYGVTMQESGVSKQVSVRFEDVGEDGRISMRSAAPPVRRAA